MDDRLGLVWEMDEVAKIFRELEAEARKCIAASGFGTIEVVIQDHEIQFSSVKLGKKHRQHQ